MQDGCKTLAQTSRTTRLTGGFVAGLVCLGVLATPLLTATQASAQGWWPWANQETPRPREPVYRGPPPAPIPPGQIPPGQGQPPPGGYGTPPGAQGRAPIPAPGAAGNICYQLEQRLVAEGQRGASTRDALPKIEGELRISERQLNQAQNQLERAECYEYFLFSKSVKNTPQCRTAISNVDTLKRKVADLDAQRQQIAGTGERRAQDDIIRELARNGCGQNYVQEARKLDQRGGGFWTTEEDPAPRGGNQFGALPFSTYRTVCVRLCDGYFFPVSFSTLPNHFPRDAELCQSRCAAPVELYYHQNPGAGMEQAVSAKSQTNYTALKTAFRYRKEFVNGCSCKEAEFQVGAGERKADAAGQPGAGPVRPASATAASAATAGGTVSKPGARQP